MKSFVKILFIFSLFFVGGFLVNTSEAQACSIQSQNIKWRAINSQGLNVIIGQGWYSDSPQPYAYLDIQTSGCTGETLQIQIWEDDTLVFGGGHLVLNTQHTVTNLNNFTMVYKVGETECDAAGSPDCQYYVNIATTGQGQIASTEGQSSPSTLNYNCDGGCSNSNAWQLIAPELAYGAYHPDDPALSANDPDNPNNQDEGPTGGGSIDIQINLSNPIGPPGMTLVDFIQKVFDLGVKIGIPLVAIGIIYSGLLFVTAGGNDSQLEKAKNAFTYAIIGGGLVLGCWIFANLIKETMESIAMIMNYFA